MKLFIIYCVLMFSLLAGSCQEPVEKTKLITKTSSKNIIELIQDQIKNEKGKLKRKKELLTKLHEYIGVRYRWGGRTKKGIDCSALVQNSYSSIGIRLPRCSYDQFEKGEFVDTSNIEVGDLLFLKNRKRVNHVGVYIGNDKVIHASGRKVKIDDVAVFYNSKSRDFVGPKRILL